MPADPEEAKEGETKMKHATFDEIREGDEVCLPTHPMKPVTIKKVGRDRVRLETDFRNERIGRWMSREEFDANGYVMMESMP